MPPRHLSCLSKHSPPLEALSTFWGNCKAPLEVHCCTWRLTETCQDLLIFEPSLSPSTKTLRKGWISREICEMHEMHTYGACLAKSSLYGSAQLVSPPLSQKLGGAKGELQGSGILMAKAPTPAQNPPSHPPTESSAKNHWNLSQTLLSLPHYWAVWCVSHSRPKKCQNKMTSVVFLDALASLRSKLRASE